MSIDVLTLGTGVFSFACFLLIHLIFFRWLAPERLLRSLLFIVVSIMGLPILLMGTMSFFKITDVPWQVLVGGALLAMLIDGLLCFVYVLCIFGPYETSVRMRLVREIAREPHRGIPLQELLSRYNVETIVKVRLRRLVGSGDIIEKDGLYRCGRTGNFFFIFDSIAGVIKKWIGR